MILSEAAFALIDTETTGTDDKAEVLEFGAHLSLADGGHPVEPFALSEMCFPASGEIPPESSGVHHITIGDVIGRSTFPDRRHILEAFVGDATPVAHNAEFDRRVVGGALGERSWLCTERLAHHLLPDAPNFKLQTLRYYLFPDQNINLEGTDEHRVDGDLIVLRHVFVQLIKHYRAFAARECAGDGDRLAKSERVETLIAFAERPYVIKTWPMGPDAARGKPFAQIDQKLLEWALRKADLSKDLRWNVERELDRRGKRKKGAAA